MLFPIAHGGDGDAQLVGELSLTEPGLGADRHDPGLRRGRLARPRRGPWWCRPSQRRSVLETRDDALEVFRFHLRNSFFNRVISALNGVAV